LRGVRQIDPRLKNKFVATAAFPLTEIALDIES
jgi:hypothetical protein